MDYKCITITELEELALDGNEKAAEELARRYCENNIAAKDHDEEMTSISIAPLDRAHNSEENKKELLKNLADVRTDSVLNIKRAADEGDALASYVYGEMLFNSQNSIEKEAGIKAMDASVIKLQEEFVAGIIAKELLCEVLSSYGGNYLTYYQSSGDLSIAKKLFNAYENAYELNNENVDGLITCFENGIGCSRDWLRATKLKEHKALKGGMIPTAEVFASYLKNGMEIESSIWAQRALESVDAADYPKLVAWIRMWLAEKGMTDQDGKPISADEASELYASSEDDPETRRILVLFEAGTVEKNNPQAQTRTDYSLRWESTSGERSVSETDNVPMEDPDYYSNRRRYYGMWADCKDWPSLMVIPEYVALYRRATEQSDIEAMLDIGIGFIPNQGRYKWNDGIIEKISSNNNEYRAFTIKNYYYWAIRAVITAGSEFNNKRYVPMKYIATAVWDAYKFLLKYADSEMKGIATKTRVAGRIAYTLDGMFGYDDDSFSLEKVFTSLPDIVENLHPFINELFGNGGRIVAPIHVDANDNTLEKLNEIEVKLKEKRFEIVQENIIRAEKAYQQWEEERKRKEEEERNKRELLAKEKEEKEEKEKAYKQAYKEYSDLNASLRILKSDIKFTIFNELIWYLLLLIPWTALSLAGLIIGGKVHIIFIITLVISIPFWAVNIKRIKEISHKKQEIEKIEKEIENKRLAMEEKKKEYEETLT